jgi:hypothetical protein
MKSGPRHPTMALSLIRVASPAKHNPREHRAAKATKFLGGPPAAPAPGRQAGPCAQVESITGASAGALIFKERMVWNQLPLSRLAGQAAWLCGCSEKERFVIWNLGMFLLTIVVGSVRLDTRFQSLLGFTRISGKLFSRLTTFCLTVA